MRERVNNFAYLYVYYSKFICTEINTNLHEKYQENVVEH